MKPVNRYTSNEFHDWQRSAGLPRGLVIQDLDAWALTISDSRVDYAPVALIELKRSSIPVDEWRLFDDDRPNFLSLLALAQRAQVPLFVVYFQKGVAIESETPLLVIRLDAAQPTYQGFRKLLTAREFVARFPLLTGPPRDRREAV